MSAQGDGASWPQFVYRLVEHYKWEKQHLSGSVHEFYARMQNQEVPLNFLFNILLCWLPAETIALMLGEFGRRADLSADNPLRVEYPWSPSFTQPDVRIESPHDRIFIEIKVDQSTKREQVQKYVLLHALMDVTWGEKRPYLFFLTRRDFTKCWKPSREVPSPFDLQSFLRGQTTDLNEQVSRRLPKEHAKAAIARYQAVEQELLYGATTWNTIGKRLSAVRPNAGTIERRVIGDFLGDLVQRKLLDPTDLHTAPSSS